MPDKVKIHAHCLQLLQEKINSIAGLIEDARAASNNDTKSSMGDKYETTREMMQIEINKLLLQLSEAQQMILSLKVIDPAKSCTKAEPGALIETQQMTFYLCTGLGKITIDNKVVMAISPASPIGKALHGKQKDDQFSVNSQNVYRILDVC